MLRKKLPNLFYGLCDNETITKKVIFINSWKDSNTFDDFFLSALHLNAFFALNRTFLRMAENRGTFPISKEGNREYGIS